MRLLWVIYIKCLLKAYAFEKMLHNVHTLIQKYFLQNKTKNVSYQKFKSFNIGELLGWLLKEEYCSEESSMPVF